jgi:UDP-glucuronate 4-epimerase
LRTIIVTGAAGFIGSETCLRLAARGDRVIGLDSFDPYYEPALKTDRAARLKREAGVEVRRLDIADAEALAALVRETEPWGVVHLAAQAGVRYSIDHPFAYERSNLAGHLSVLEACRHAEGLEHLVYASSSSVYGDRPASGAAFRETDPVDHPVSLYAATKRAGELMSDTYAHLYCLPQSGLRFFTVYGPWGRPDMAYFSFTRRVLAGEPIEVYGEGEMARDFTFVDDIVAGVLGVLDRPPERGGHRILNIGADRPRALMDFVRLIEAACGREADLVLRPMQPGDVTTTWADVSALKALTGYAPQTTLEAGITRFVAWYRGRYRDDGKPRG